MPRNLRGTGVDVHLRQLDKQIEYYQRQADRAWEQRQALEGQRQIANDSERLRAWLWEKCHNVDAVKLYTLICRTLLEEGYIPAFSELVKRAGRDDRNVRTTFDLLVRFGILLDERWDYGVYKLTGKTKWGD